VNVKVRMISSFDFRNTPIYTANINLIGTGVLSDTNKQLTASIKKSDGIAHPNDRATSIRPANRTEKVKYVTFY